MFVYMDGFKWMEIDFKDVFYVILLQIYMSCIKQG